MSGNPPRRPAADPSAELWRIVLEIADDLAALADRVLHLEAAVHHLADILGFDLSSVPDPTTPRARA